MPPRRTQKQARGAMRVPMSPRKRGLRRRPTAPRRRGPGGQGAVRPGWEKVGYSGPVGSRSYMVYVPPGIGSRTRLLLLIVAMSALSQISAGRRRGSRARCPRQAGYQPPR